MSPPPVAGEAGRAPRRAWADEVCTSIATWRTEVESIATNATDALTEPGATRTDVEAAVESGLDATKTLGDELRAAVPPDTPEGQEAKAALDGFLDKVQQSDDKVRTAIAGLPENAGLAQIVAELSGLATGLQQTVESGRTLVTDIQELGSALKDGFENADSCQELAQSARKAGISRALASRSWRTCCRTSRHEDRSPGSSCRR